MIKRLLVISLLLNIILLTLYINKLDADVLNASKNIISNILSLKQRTQSSNAPEIDQDVYTQPDAPTRNMDDEQFSENEGAPSETINLPPFFADMREEIMARAQAETWSELGELLRTYLAQYPQDETILFIEGQYVIYTQTSAAGLVNLYQLLAQTQNEALANTVNNYIDTHARQIIMALAHNQSWYALSVFIEPLLQIDFNNRLYIEYLALSYAHQDLPNSMYNVLASVSVNDPIAQRVEQVWQRWHNGKPPSTDESPLNNTLRNQVNDKNTDAPGLISLPLTRIDNQFVARLELAGNSLSLLLDTGASSTAISRDAFNAINPSKTRFLGRIVVNTASGPTQAELYEVEDIIFANVNFRQLNIVVLPVDRMGGQFNGLLGMDVLNQFDWQIDSINNQLLLRPVS